MGIKMFDVICWVREIVAGADSEVFCRGSRRWLRAVAP